MTAHDKTAPLAAGQSDRVSYSGTIDPSHVPPSQWPAVEKQLLALLEQVGVDPDTVTLDEGVHLDYRSLTIRIVTTDGMGDARIECGQVVTDHVTRPLPEGHSGWIEVPA